jgi:predicted MFS family arabinose efflux permease
MMKKWLRYLLIADFFMLLAMWMLTPIYAIFVEEIGGDILAASSAWALFSLTSGVLIYFSGKWQDGLKKRGITHNKFISLGYLIRCIAFLGYFFVADKFQLFAVQVLLGIGVAASVPAFDSLYSKLLTKGRYASEWGAWEGMNMIVASIGAVIGGVVASYFGFKALFLVMFASSLIGFIISRGLPSKEKAKT